MQTSSLFISLIQHHAPEWSSIHTTKIFVLFFPFLPSTSLAAIARGTITRTLFTSTPPPAQKKKKKKTTIKEKKKSIGCLCTPNFGKLFYDRLLFNIFLPFHVPFLCHIISLQSKALELVCN
jgi:hypothetical protein